jgi:hypothetical protein
MFIDKITIDGKQLLLIELDGVIKVYEWLSGDWEPVGPSKIDGIVISGKAHVQGILLTHY